MLQKTSQSRKRNLGKKTMSWIRELRKKPFKLKKDRRKSPMNKIGSWCLLGKINQELWPDRSQVLTYIVIQISPNLTNIDGKNLQVCWLEIDEPISGKTPIQQTMRVYGKGLLGYPKVLLELGSKDVMGVSRLITSVSNSIWPFGDKLTGWLKLYKSFHTHNVWSNQLFTFVGDGLP